MKGNHYTDSGWFSVDGYVRRSLICLECDSNFEMITFADDFLGTLECLSSLPIFDECEPLEKVVRVSVIAVEHPPSTVFVFEASDSEPVRVKICINLADRLNADVREFRSFLTKALVEIFCCAFNETHDEICLKLGEASKSEASFREFDCTISESTVAKMIGRDCYLLEQN